MQKRRFHIGSLLIFSILFLTLSCGGGDDDTPPPIPDPPRSAADVKEDFKNLAIKEGINDLVLESLEKGVFWKFRLIVPEGATASNKRPLVLRLHGAARSGSAEAHKSTSCLVEPAFAGKDVFILSPNSNGEFWYAQRNIVQVLALMELTSDDLNIDKNKTVVMGFSDGGNGSWFYAQYYEGLVAASIPMASSYDSKDASGNVSKINVPLYVIHGSEDELFPIETTKGFVDASVTAGSDITFIVGEGLVHVEPCTYLDELKKAVIWLETEIW